MQKSEVKTIAFKGIERINERINCNEGACEEIINLRPEGNTWHNIGKRKQITQNGLSVSGDVDYSVIIHPASKDKYYIVWDKTNSNIILYDSQTEKIKQILLNTDNIISVSYLDNVLIVCTQNKKYYFLYDAQTQEYKAISFNNVSANITAKSNSVAKPFKQATADYKKNVVEQKTTIEDSFMCWVYDKSNRLFQLGSIADVTTYEKINNIDIQAISDAAKSFIGFTDDKILSLDKYKKCFRGLSFYRVAFKMTDGSYVNYSNISFADTNGDDVSTQGSFYDAFPITIVAKSNAEEKNGKTGVFTDSVISYNPYGTHKINITFSSLAEIKQLMKDSLIQSVDVFMTRPIFSVDFDKTSKINYYNNVYKLKHDSGQKWAAVYSDTHYYGYGYIFAHFPRNEEQFNQQLYSGTYYKVKSYNKDDIDKLTDNYIEYEITHDDIKALEGNSILPTPTTDNEVLFKDSYNYNSKQHLYNLFYNIFKGYDFPQGNGINGIFNNLINTIGHSSAVDGLYYTIKGDYNGENFAVKHKINNPDNFFTFDFMSFYLTLPRFFSYPINDKITFGIYIIYQNGDAIKLFENDFNNLFASGNSNIIANVKITGEDFVINTDSVALSPNINYNSKTLPPVQVDMDFDTGSGGSDSVLNSNPKIYALSDLSVIIPESHFNPISVAISLQDLKMTSFKEILQTSNKNILQLTETDNPFVLPSSENYSFGEKGNEILAISSNSGLTTDRNFGTYPLYVFTTDGVYTMAVGSGNVAYSNIIQLNTTQIINKNVLNTPLGVMFLSKRGLCFINGRQIQCISDLVKGNPTITSDDNRGKLLKLAPDSINPVTFQKIKDLSAIVDLNALTPQDDDFLSEILTSQFYYDEVHNEVCIVVKEKYTYVFNLSLNVFYKRSDYFQVENGRTLSIKTLYEQDPDGRKPTPDPNNPFSFNKGGLNGGVVQTDKTKTLIHLFSFDEQFSEDEDICKSVAIITKPFLLDTRHFKNIERIIFDMSWRDKDDFYLVLFGSKDGVNYNIVKKCIKKTNDKGKDHQDVYLDLVLSTVKYCFLCICSRNFYDTRIANVTFQFKQTANYGGIR